MGKDRLPASHGVGGPDIPEKTPLTPEVVDNPPNLCACSGCIECSCVGECDASSLDLVKDPLEDEALERAAKKSCRPRGSVIGGRRIS